MDKISKEEFFSAIRSSAILVPYLEQNPDLAELLESPAHPDIHYFGNYALAKELLPALKRRLDHMVSRNIDPNLQAMKQLVAFMEQHLDSQICNVTFNCPTQHYGVRCALVDDQIHVICVITGGHIPDELLGESAK